MPAAPGILRQAVSHPSAALAKCYLNSVFDLRRSAFLIEEINYYMSKNTTKQINCAAKNLVELRVLDSRPEKVPLKEWKLPIENLSNF